MATPAQWERLAEVCVWALDHQPNPEVAAATATQLERGRWRPTAVFAWDEDGNLDALSFQVRVDIADGAGGWVPLVQAHWRDLGLTLDDVFDAATEMAQSLKCPDTIEGLVAE